MNKEGKIFVLIITIVYLFVSIMVKNMSKVIGGILGCDIGTLSTSLLVIISIIYLLLVYNIFKKYPKYKR